MKNTSRRGLTWSRVPSSLFIKNETSTSFGLCNSRKFSSRTVTTSPVLRGRSTYRCSTRLSGVIIPHLATFGGRFQSTNSEEEKTLEQANTAPTPTDDLSWAESAKELNPQDLAAAAELVKADPGVVSSFFSMFPGAIESALVGLHGLTGIPYWGTIVVATAALRIALLPFAIMGTRRTAFLTNAGRELQATVDKVPEQYPNLSAKELKMKQAQVAQDFYRSRGISPFGALGWNMASIPFFISFFFGIRKMCEELPDMATGGLWWFADLASPDPYGRLAILAGLTTGLSFELSNKFTGVAPNPIMQNILRGISLLTIALTWNFQPAVHVYWVTMATLTLGQSFLLNNPACRSLFKIPVVKPQQPLAPPKIPKMVYKKPKSN